MIFTLDTESGFRDVVFVTGAYGLGENVVQGKVDPDEFYVHKPTFRQGHRAVLRRSLGGKQMRMVYARGPCRHDHAQCADAEAEPRALLPDDADVLELADYAIRIEEHYSAAGRAPDADGYRMGQGRRGRRLYIVQARPETVASRKRRRQLRELSR